MTRKYAKNRVVPCKRVKQHRLQPLAMTNQSLTNGTNETNCEHSEPEVSMYFRLVITTLILVVAFLGNIVVLRAICRLPSQKPFIYLLVGNLAAGELGQVILQPFLLFYEETWRSHGWPFGKFMCKVINPLQNVFSANITITLGAIAVYRCLMMYSPPRSKLSPLKAKSLLASFWCVGLAFAIPESAKREFIPCPADPTIENCCGPNWDKTSVRIYHLLWMIVLLCIPMVTMIVAYALVAIKIRRHITITKMQSQEEMQLQSYEATNNSEEPKRSQTRSARDEVAELENNLLKMMYIIVVSFVICYLPYPILFALFHYGVLNCWRFTWIFEMYSFTMLSNLPSALHPLFYGTKSKFFARAFSRLLSCKKNK